MAPSGKRKSTVNVGAYRYQDRVAAERTQFYERLSMLPQDVMMKILSRHSIPASDKRKKTSLTEELCTFTWRISSFLLVDLFIHYQTHVLISNRVKLRGSRSINCTNDRNISRAYAFHRHEHHSAIEEGIASFSLHNDAATTIASITECASITIGSHTRKCG
jgi:hypothetical protein